MPRLEIRNRRQKALLWLVTDRDENNEPVLADPVELKVRWQDKQVQMMAPDNTTIWVDSIVVVGQVVPIGSLMWLGTLKDLSGTARFPEKNIMEVIAHQNTPSIKNRGMRRVVGLHKFRNTV